MLRKICNIDIDYVKKYWFFCAVLSETVWNGNAQILVGLKFVLLFCRFNLKSAVLRPAALNLPRLNYSSLNGGGSMNNKFKNRSFLHAVPPGGVFQVGVRSYGMIAVRYTRIVWLLFFENNKNVLTVYRVLRGALRLRYLLLGGAITGGVTLNKVSVCGGSTRREILLIFEFLTWFWQRYEEWKDGLPDMKWLEDIFPDNQQWKQFSRDLATVTKSVAETIEIG